MNPCPIGLVCVPSSQTCELTLVDSGIDSPPSRDGSAMGSGATCFGSGFVTACFAAPPSGTVVITGSVDTDTDSRCDTAITATCTIAAMSLATTGSVRATGTRPLVLVGADAVNIEGTLDVASHVGSDDGAAANNSACESGTSVMVGSLAGAAGGSFATVGGAGGRGADGAPAGKPAAAVAPTTLRGGCPGQGTGDTPNGTGSGGAGGGAVYLIAGSQILIQGTIDASGAGAASQGLPGGAPSGGCGGGAGGMIGFDAPNIELAGIVFANGGGGGGGDAEEGGAGGAGADPTGVGAALGGAGGSAADPLGGGGAGGDGAAAGGAGATGGSGGADGGTGGGGGGGEGAIVVFGTLQGAGGISPPPMKN
jgi:hypothetical protein